MLRLIVSYELASFNGGINNVFMPPVTTDLATYMQLAKEVAAGKFTGEFYYQPFYYAVFLPAIYLISNGSVWLVMVVQSMQGAATVWLAGLIAKEIFGGRAAPITAALLTAVAAPLLLYTPYHQNETLQTFNLALLLFLALRAMRGDDWRLWAATGVMTGVAILTRGNIWFMVPGLLIGLIASGYRANRSKYKIIGTLALFIGLTLLVQLPFAWRNSQISGRLRGPSTAADAVLALGNTREAPAGGREPGLPAGPMEYPASWHKLMDSHTPALTYAMAWLKTEPLSFIELQFRKILLFWDYREIPNNVSISGDGGKSVVISAFAPVGSGIIAALGLAGLIFTSGRVFKKRDIALALLDYFVIAYMLATAAFYILGRFRAPVLPLLAVAGGGFVSAFHEVCEKKNRGFTLFFAVSALFGVFISFCAYDFYRYNLESVVMRLVRPGGTRDWGSVFDHGPMTLGGWQVMPVASGGRVVKSFAGVRGQGTLSVTLFAEHPTKCVLMINHRVHILTISNPGLQQYDFEVDMREGSLVIEIIDSGKISFVADFQRNYGRSELNGSTIPAEWVMRFR